METDKCEHEWVWEGEDENTTEKVCKKCGILASAGEPKPISKDEIEWLENMEYLNWKNRAEDILDLHGFDTGD